MQRYVILNNMQMYLLADLKQKSTEKDCWFSEGGDMLILWEVDCVLWMGTTRNLNCCHFKTEICIFLVFSQESQNLRQQQSHLTLVHLVSVWSFSNSGGSCVQLWELPPSLHPSFFPSSQITAASLSLGHAVICDRKASIKLRWRMPRLRLLPSQGSGLGVWVTL